MRPDAAVFILTNRRPDRLYTLRLLERSGYTGKWYLVVDDEDPTLPEYQTQYGDRVLVFDKKAQAARTDTANNFGNRSAVVFARNACFDLARELGLTYFIQLDDDYTSFAYVFDEDLVYGQRPIRSLDTVFEALIDFLEDTSAKSVAMAQGGDLIGGENGAYGKKVRLTRKCMNSFVCKTDRPINFVGHINEDVNTYVLGGQRGDLYFTVGYLTLNQLTTQTNPGGLTETYLADGTYVKSFYSVMHTPSCVTVSDMGSTDPRLHHRVAWNNAVPKIMSEKHRK